LLMLQVLIEFWRPHK